MTVLLTNAVLILAYATLLRGHKKVVVILCGLQLFFVLALRGEFYGTDALYYSNGYAYISSMSLEQMIACLNPNLLNISNLVYPYSYELGWVVLNWLFGGLLGLDYRVFMVALSAFTAGSFALFSYRYSKDPGYSLFVISCLSFFLYSFFILRQTLALCICLLAVPFLLERKPVRFIALVFLAFLFHRSALVFLVLYPFCGRKVTKGAFNKGLLAFCVCLVLSLTVLPSVVSFLFGIMGKSHWIGDIGFSWNNLIALQLFIVICCLAFDIDQVAEDKLDNVALWAVLVSCVTYAVMLNNEVLARANEYLWIFVALLIPAMLQRLDPHMRTLGRMCVGMLLLGFLAYQVSGSDLDPYVLMSF